MSFAERSGGRCNMTISGRPYSLRGAITIKNAGMSREAAANYDNTMYVTTRPGLVTAEISLSDHLGVDLRTLMADRYDVTFTHYDMGRTDFFTDAQIVGDPSINMETGEITGFTVSVPESRYRRTEQAA